MNVLHKNIFIMYFVNTVAKEILPKYFKPYWMLLWALPRIREDKK